MARDREVNVISICALSCELLTLIVTMMNLPLHKIFQLRLVCKRWNLLLQDRDFLQRLFCSIGQSPVLIYCPPYDDVLRAYSTHLGDWHKWTPSLESDYFSRYRVYREVGDLLLVEDMSVESKKQGMYLQLVNPAMKWQRKLPSLPSIDEWDPFVIGMGPDASSKSYRVFIVNRFLVKINDASWGHWVQKAYFYNCGLNFWEVIGPWQEKAREYIAAIELYEGTLHSIIVKQDEYGDEIDKKLCRFDEKKLLWEELSVLIPSSLIPSSLIASSLYYEGLFEWQGHLMLIGVERIQPSLLDVHIWQLEQGNNIWVKTMTMPGYSLDQLHLGNPDFMLIIRISSVGSSTPYIRITSSLQVSHATKSGWETKHVIFDLSKRLWLELEVLEPFYDELFTSGLLMPRFGFETF